MSAVKLLKPIHPGMNELNKVWSEVCGPFFFALKSPMGLHLPIS